MTPNEANRRANIHEWLTRFQRLLKRGVSVKAAEVVVDAAMFGYGCTEGEVRVKQQEEIDDAQRRSNQDR